MPFPPLLAAGWWLLALPPASPQVPPPLADAARSAELRARRDAIIDDERARLVAARVATDPAIAPAADGSTRFVLLPEVVPASPRGPDDGQGGRRPARDPIRAGAAKALFELAGVAARSPSPSYALADQCLRDVLERLPDHPEARRLLGFLPHDGGWATPFAADLLARGNVSDPIYGWVPGDWVAHLGRGELPAPGGSNRWLPAAQADDLRRNWNPCWTITTEHFTIRTNVPMSEAISFGHKLEALHQLFFALMADVFDPDQLPLAQRYKLPTLKPSISKKTYRVSYFATREEYAQHLAPIMGAGSRVSLGTYITRKEDKSRQFGGVSYFFNDVGGQIDVTSTLFHEASHQLLFESAGPDNFAQNRGNYWVFEGLGTYFETLEIGPGGRLRIGGLIGPRIAQARQRLVADREFIPIEEFVGLGEVRFKGEQGPGTIYLRYAEAMALAVFLMQAEGGRFREPFLDYVRDAYKGRLRGVSGRTLEDHLGVRYRDLDRAFLEYLGKPPGS